MQLPDLAEAAHRAHRSLENSDLVDLEQVERSLLQQALHRTNGNVSAAARLLSIGREAMRYRMAKFGLVGGKEMAHTRGD
jgi:DNA-binding NtrC family response regulator